MSGAPAAQAGLATMRPPSAVGGEVAGVTPELIRDLAAFRGERAPVTSCCLDVVEDGRIGAFPRF